jgi:mono/diheme cytochrome c family protein
MSRNITILSSLILILIISACTGLSSEPEIVATLLQATSVVETLKKDSLFPTSKPDITNGAQIFAEHCTECHSEIGNGLGALVLEGGIPQPPDMTDVSATSLKTPLKWYNTITNGNLEFLMPPWKNALTTQERWDVAFYTYTLGYDENMLILGEQVWTDKCNGCESLSGLIDLESAVTISDTSFGNQIDRNNFNSTLSTGEIYAAAAYARSLSVDNPTSIASIPESIPVSEDPNIKHGNFTGVVEQGTAGSTVPTDTIIQMQYGNMQNGYEFAQTTINEDFTYTFEDIPLTTAFTYNIGAIYRDRLYTSRLMEGHPEGIDYNQTLTIYDLTDDAFVLSVSQIDIFIDSIDVPDLGSGLRITQVIHYNNSSDRMYTTGQQIGDGREATLLVQIPVGAIITSDEENGRYIIVQGIEGILDSIIDTYSVQPGDNHDIFIEYFVPYENGAIIDQPFNNVINGDVTITLSNNLTVVSDDFIQNEDSNIPENLMAYTGHLNIDTDPALVFEIAGNPFVTTSDGKTIITTDTLFPILLGGIVLLTVVIIVIIAIAGRGNDDRHDIDALIKQIAELDTMHDNGQINHDVYQRQRQELKQQLTHLMQPKPTQEDA